MNATSTSVPVGDIDIACTVVGEGIPVVVVGEPWLGAGYLRGLDTWSTGFRLVYVDQRGSGATAAGDPSRVSLAGAIDDLDRLRMGLGAAQINLVGHSAGAILAALYAGRHAETTASVVLLNPGPPLDPQLRIKFEHAMAARRTADDDAARAAIEQSAKFRARDPKMLERHTLNTYLPFFRERSTIETVDLAFTAITAQNVLAGPGRMFGGIGALDPFGIFAQIRCPTLVVHSELDPIPVEWAHTLVEAIPDADFVLLEDAGHFAHIEDAEQLAGAALPWLAEHAR